MPNVTFIVVIIHKNVYYGWKRLVSATLIIIVFDYWLIWCHKHFFWQNWWSSFILRIVLKSKLFSLIKLFSQPLKTYLSGEYHKCMIIKTCVFLHRVRHFENGAGESIHLQISTVMGICFFTSFRGRHIEKAMYPLLILLFFRSNHARNWNIFVGHVRKRTVLLILELLIIQHEHALATYNSRYWLLSWSQRLLL